MEPRIGKTIIDFLRKKGYQFDDNLETLINDLLDQARDNRDLMVLRGHDRNSLRFSTEEVVQYLIKEGLVE